jgi:hypothetical protein
VRVSLLARFTQSGDQAIVAPARELLDYHADRVVDVVVAGEGIHLDGRRAGGAGRPAAASADWLVGGRISKARLKSYRHGFPSSRTVQLGPLFRRSRLPQRRTTCASPDRNGGRTIPAQDPEPGRPVQPIRPNSMSFAPGLNIGLVPEGQNGGAKVVNVVPCRSRRNGKMHPEIFLHDLAIDDVDIDVFHLPAKPGVDHRVPAHQGDDSSTTPNARRPPTLAALLDPRRRGEKENGWITQGSQTWGCSTTPAFGPGDRGPFRSSSNSWHLPKPLYKWRGASLSELAILDE